MERPCWTLVFLFIWLLVAPGVILTHMAVAALVPSLRDLPANIVEGFDETFKFAYLESDSMTIKDEALAALGKCNAAPNPNCNYPNPLMPGPDIDVTMEKDMIVDIFDSTLDIVSKVANDIYFGIPSLQDTAIQLNDIKSDIDNAPDQMKCIAVKRTFCGIHNSAKKLTEGMSMVNDALDTFRSNSVVTSWEDYAGYMAGLHALPWILVLGMCFFLIFWLKAGRCCPWGFCLVPFIMLWLLNFVLYLVILAAGVAIMYGADRVKMPMLNGEPTLDMVIEHFKTEFSEFWELVFTPMIDGMMSLFNASCFFVPVLIFMAFYGLLMCCCCPYSGGKKADAVAPAESAERSYSGPMNETAARGFLQAARAEYVQGQGAKVGDYFESLPGADGAFGKFEDQIRGANDKAAAIDALESDWGL